MGCQQKEFEKNLVVGLLTETWWRRQLSELDELEGSVLILPTPDLITQSVLVCFKDIPKRIICCYDIVVDRLIGAEIWSS